MRAVFILDKEAYSNNTFVTLNWTTMFFLSSGYLLSCCKSRIVCQPDDTADVALVCVVSRSTSTNVGMHHVILFASLWIM